MLGIECLRVSEFDSRLLFFAFFFSPLWAWFVISSEMSQERLATPLEAFGISWEVLIIIMQALQNAMDACHPEDHILAGYRSFLLSKSSMICSPTTGNMHVKHVKLKHGREI